MENPLQQAANAAFVRLPYTFTQLGVPAVEPAPSGADAKMQAGVEAGNPVSPIFVGNQAAWNNPDYTPQLLRHEMTHRLQDNWPQKIQNALPPVNPADPYNYGGAAGLQKVGGDPLKLSREQSAAAEQALQAMQQSGAPIPSVYKTLDRKLQSVPLSVMQPTDPNAPGINTNPRNPGLPAGYSMATGRILQAQQVIPVPPGSGQNGAPMGSPLTPQNAVPPYNPMVPPGMANSGNPLTPPNHVPVFQPPPPPVAQGPGLGFQMFAQDPLNNMKVQHSMSGPDTPLQPNAGAQSQFGAAAANPPAQAPMASVLPPQGQLNTDEAKLQHLQSSGSGASQVKNPFLRRLAEAGDIIGSIAAPEFMAFTPGTTLHNRVLQNYQQQNIANDQNAITSQLRNAQTQAQTNLTNADVAQAQRTPQPPLVTTDQGMGTVSGNTFTPLQGPNGQPVNAPPKAGTMRAATVVDPATGKPVLANFQNGKYFGQDGKEIANAQPFTKSGAFHVQPVTENGQPTFAYAVPGKGWFDVSGTPLTGKVTPATAKNGSVMSLFAAEKFLHESYSHNPALLKYFGPLIAQSFQQQGFAVPAELSQAIATMPEDQPLSPTTGNPIGTSMPGAPTGQTRVAAQNAQKFLDEYPRITAEVNAAAPNLGPVKGREVMGFLLGSVGSTGDPATDRKLSGLRTDMTFVGSNAAKFHVNSVRQAEMFDKLAATGKSTAPAIQGFLDSVKHWANTSAKQERGYGEQGNPLVPPTPNGKPHFSYVPGKGLTAN